jgi:hypothetical protein
LHGLPILAHAIRAIGGTGTPAGALGLIPQKPLPGSGLIMKA